MYLIGANQTPFLNMIGGLQGERIRIVKDFQFALAQPWALESASQPAITENGSKTAPTATTYVRGQDVNTCQIFQESVEVTYAKSSVTGQVKADPTTGLVDISEGQPVVDEMQFQQSAAMRQVALDVEYTFLNGVYQQAVDADTAPKCRGILTACTTNAVAASSAVLSRDLVNTLLRTMADNGAIFENAVILCGGFQKQKLTEIFGYAPEDRNVGGVNIKQIETDFAMLGVVWAPRVPAGSLLIADLSVCSPVFLPVPGAGVLFYKELAVAGAVSKGHIYGQIGLDYGAEEFHGKITGLATS